MVRFSVRRATLRDLETLVDQRHKMFDAFRDVPEEAHAIGDREYRKWARARMRRKELVAWLAETVPGGRAVAGGAVWLIEHQPRPGTPAGKTPYLLSMFTEREFRGRGLASRIVREAMRWARGNGYPRMTLHASKFGRSVYRKLGWERTWEMRVMLGSAVRRPPATGRRTAKRPRAGDGERKRTGAPGR